jgi:hypothetical protein
MNPIIDGAQAILDAGGTVGKLQPRRCTRSTSRRTKSTSRC